MSLPVSVGSLSVVGEWEFGGGEPGVGWRVLCRRGDGRAGAGRMGGNGVEAEMSGDHEGNAASAGNAGDAVGRTAGWQEFGRRGLSEQESGRRGLSEQEFGRTRSGKHEPGSHEAGNELGNAPGSEPGGRELGNEVPGNEELGSEEPGNEKSGKAPGGRGQDGETRKTVWVALGANLGIAVAKAVGGGLRVAGVVVRGGAFGGRQSQ